jgi:ribosomal protein S8
MARTIILELTDEQEQQLLRQAAQLNLPPESVLLRSLQTDSNGSPPPPSDSTTQLFQNLRQAIQEKQAIAIAPANELTLQIAQTLKASQIILEFQVSNQQLVLSVNPNPPVPSFTTSTPEDPPQYPPELAKIAQQLQQTDPTTRAQAIIDLAGWYREQA